MDYLLSELTDAYFLTILLRLFLAVIFGGIIGLERGRRRRAAGLRTHVLVCLGATLVMCTNQYVSIEYGVTDLTRMGAQVISGIGFLGVGTIIVDRQHQVRGLTTAAGLWVCACMGLALGIGFYTGAAITFVFIIIANALLNRLEQRIIRRTRTIEVYAEYKTAEAFGDFLDKMAENSIKIMHLDYVKPRTPIQEEHVIAAVLTLKLPKRALHSSVIERLHKLSTPLILEELT